MFRYILRRLLISLPTIFMVCLIVFALNKCAPGDPVEEVLGQNYRPPIDPEAQGIIYRNKAAQLGLDAPVFFFSLTTAAYPDTMWKIYPPDRRSKLASLLEQTGNWTTTRTYDAALNHVMREMERMPDSNAAKPHLFLQLQSLVTVDRLEKIPYHLHLADSIAATTAVVQPQMAAALDSLDLAVNHLQNSMIPANHYLPKIHWYPENQFGHWMQALFHGNWGITLSNKPVWPEVKISLYYSMAVNLIALALAYLIAVPLGVAMARSKGKRLDRWSKRSLFFVSAMPVFWMGGLLAILVTAKIFSKPLIASPYLSISDQWIPGSESFVWWFFANFYKFALPITVLTLHAVAVIAVQMRGGMLENLGLDYIRTARAKGVGENQVMWKHAFRNALFPIITIFGSLFPALFTGSLVIETMFNYPGIGLKTQNAFGNHDLSTLSFILIAAAVLTILGNLVADILYAVADPRVRFSGD